MANSSGTITASPRLRDDIAAVLGVADTRLSYLCSNAHGKINKWARYKPVRYPHPWARQVDQYWYRSPQGNGGLQYRAGYVLEDYKSGVTYTYLPPRGGESEPYRLGDFIGYYRLAEPFIKTGLAKDTVKTIDFGLMQSFVRIPIQKNSSSHSLGIEDVFSMASRLQLGYTLYLNDPLTAEAPQPAGVEEISSSTVVSSSSLIFDVKPGTTEPEQTRYAVFFLYDPATDSRYPLPMEDGCWPVVAIKTAYSMPVNVSMDAAAMRGQSAWIAANGSGHLPANSSSELQLKITVTNRLDSQATLNDSFHQWRVQVSGPGVTTKTVNLGFRTGLNGNALATATLAANATGTFYLQTNTSVLGDIAAGKIISIALQLNINNHGWTTISNQRFTTE